MANSTKNKGRIKKENQSMDNELTEVYAFIKQIAPFEHLPERVIVDLVSCIEICYLVKDDQLSTACFTTPHIIIVRKGVVIAVNPLDELLGKFAEGDVCKLLAYTEKYGKVAITADEDCLIYALDKEKMFKVLANHTDILRFFEQSSEDRLKHTVSKLNDESVLNSSLTNTSIEEIYHTPIVTINKRASITATAKKMTELNFSCLVVVGDADEIIGIVTDKDFRRRCIAQNISADSPIENIMSKNITSLDVRASVFDAIITMTSNHIHHLPITNQGELAGMLTISDLMHFEGENAINLTSLIHKANTVDELANIGKLVPKLQIKMAKLNTTGPQVAKSISTITMAFTIRLIEISEQTYGESPVPYAWLSAGSQARQEQLTHSDQDNALIIDDSMQPEHAAWFEQLAIFVCDGLNQCGFDYCPGNIMATNIKWRQRAQVWEEYFYQWVECPDPKALLHSSIFFDLSTIYGDKSLLNTVRTNMLRRTQKSSLFIAHLSRNALQHNPPLGFFRDFVLISNGKDKKTMDLKHNGVALVVDLARIYALKEGISCVNTLDRLKRAAGTPSLTKGSAANLIDAFEFLSTLRLNHQSRQLVAKTKPDNFLSPTEISRLEREHLKDAFKVIKTLQDNRQSVY